MVHLVPDCQSQSPNSPESCPQSVNWEKYHNTFTVQAVMFTINKYARGS